MIGNITGLNLSNISVYQPTGCFFNGMMNINCVMREICPQFPDHLRFWAYVLVIMFMGFYAALNIYTFQPWYRNDYIDEHKTVIAIWFERRIAWLGFLLALLILTI